MTDSAIGAFIRAHFRHFNARVLRDAAEAYKRHVESAGKVLVALGGAMSTAEIGVSMAEMIRERKIHAVSCTGANLEEDLFNLVAHRDYKTVSNFRAQSPAEDADLFGERLNRVTDTCLPDRAIWARLEAPFMKAWRDAQENGERLFPYEVVFKVLRSGCIEHHYQIDPRDSWVLAAMEANVPIFVPGWEDSSLGNMFAAACIRGELRHEVVRSGIETMAALAEWYCDTSRQSGVGFFQVGGGVAGDFAICVVPLLHDDLLRTEVPKWAYFCQVGDSTTSYGSYSGAPPSEKISWGKLDVGTPSFMIESDATIVVPLVFAYVLGW